MGTHVNYQHVVVLWKQLNSKMSTLHELIGQPFSCLSCAYWHCIFLTMGHICKYNFRISTTISLYYFSLDITTILRRITGSWCNRGVLCYTLFNHYLIHLQTFLHRFRKGLPLLPLHFSFKYIKSQTCEFSESREEIHTNDWKTWPPARHLHYTWAKLFKYPIIVCLMLHQHLSTSIDFSFTTSNCSSH